MSIKFKATRFIEHEPVTFKYDGGADVNAVSVFGRYFPADVKDGTLTAILSLPAGEYELDPIKAELPGLALVPSGDEKDGKLDVMIDGKLFTSYVYTDKLFKPYLGPVMTSFGESYTRLDFETKEHPHHRSVFFGVGDVSLDGRDDIGNVDFWNEPANCGIQTHVGIEDVTVGSASASFTAKTLWSSHDGEPMADAACEYKFYAQPEGCRYVDVAMTFTASYGELHFGATKEAGPLGVRMADPLRVENGGDMRNSYGASGERECWGKAANWCVYGGELSGRKVGIAVFDNEGNERYPTTWHIRNYGLFAANNLYFRGGLTIPKGESLTYRYRIVFFEGVCELPRIADPKKLPRDLKFVNIRDKFIEYCK